MHREEERQEMEYLCPDLPPEDQISPCPYMDCPTCSERLDCAYREDGELSALKADACEAEERFTLDELEEHAGRFRRKG